MLLVPAITIAAVNGGGHWCQLRLFAVLIVTIWLEPLHITKRQEKYDMPLKLT
jgi:hypothetical protein